MLGKKSIAPLALAAATFASPSAAANCTGALIEKAEASLPAAIAIKEGESPIATLARSYGCDLGDYQPWKGISVGDEEGNELGTIAGIAASTSDPSRVIFWGYKQDSKAKFALDPYGIDVKETTLLGQPSFVTVSKPNAYLAYYNKNILDPVTSKKIQMEEFKSLPIEMGQAKVMASINFALPPGLKPYEDRIHLEIASIPDGAQIAVGTNDIGTTAMEFMMRQEDVQSIALTRSGFVRCQFTDGKFEPATTADGMAKFTCSLKRAGK